MAALDWVTRQRRQCVVVFCRHLVPGTLEVWPGCRSDSRVSWRVVQRQEACVLVADSRYRDTPTRCEALDDRYARELWLWLAEWTSDRRLLSALSHRPMQLWMITPSKPRSIFVRRLLEFC